MKINKLFDYSDFSNKEFTDTQEKIYEDCCRSRKSWEFTILYYGLEKSGYLTKDKTALGTGCLHETLIYLFCDKLKAVTATDVAYYPITDARIRPWGGEKYTIEEVINGPIPYDKSKLTVIPMDMMNLEFPADSFDIIWCSSSVEHCGGVDAVLKCFTEAERVLKPNGIYAITTEWNLSLTPSCARFANVQTVDNDLLKLIETTAPKLKLVEPISFEQSDHPKNKEREYMLGKTNRFYGDLCDYTSLSLFYKKEA